MALTTVGDYTPIERQLLATVIDQQNQIDELRGFVVKMSEGLNILLSRIPEAEDDVSVEVPEEE